MVLGLAVVPGDGYRRHSNNGCEKSSVSLSKTCVVYLLFFFVFLGLVGCLFGKLISGTRSAVGCREDNEGSWAIGVMFGDSPLSLKPIEDSNIWKDEGASWPVANPVVTCASVSEAGFPSNFVADPFLYIQGNILYLFYETKNSITMQGDIGVAKSIDNGVTWQPLGIALDEDWHLSYPYVFDYKGNIYMMPEGSGKGDLRLYRAIEFPLKWALDKIIINKPMVDSFIIPHHGTFWLFGSDHSRVGSMKNGELEIWYSSSPFGPWKPHKKNPVYNTHRTMGARNGGRPFVYNGNLYRIGQDCGENYGRRIRIFKVEVLTTENFKEVEVPSGIVDSIKGRNAWNGVRHHHLDVQELSSGKWIAVVDGDRVPSNDTNRRLILGSLSVTAAAALVVLFGMLIGFVQLIVPLSWCPHSLRKRSDTLILSRDRSSSNLCSQARALCSQMSRASMNIRGKINLKTCTGVATLFSTVLLAGALTCVGVWYMYGGNGAQEPYPVKGHYSQFTLMAMTYDARLWNLKVYVKHYSRCPSVREIVIVWNKGVPPHPDDFDSAVPVRIRVEKENSLNNRFKVDPLIKTRGVLELDDDIIMSCNDIERGFMVWRQNPSKMVGFYPRLVSSRIKYRDEKYARRHGGYNMILTGAAFLDGKMAFERYWSDVAAQGREWVDKNFNCEDVLMNYLYGNFSTTSSNVVEYVKPAWVLETSKLSGVGISKDTQAHYDIRTKCVAKFSEIYGALRHPKSNFGQRKDGFD